MRRLWQKAVERIRSWESKEPEQVTAEIRRALGWFFVGGSLIALVFQGLGGRLRYAGHGVILFFFVILFLVLYLEMVASLNLERTGSGSRTRRLFQNWLKPAGLVVFGFASVAALELALFQGTDFYSSDYAMFGFCGSAMLFAAVLMFLFSAASEEKGGRKD